MSYLIVVSVVHLNCRLSDILTSESINKNKFLNVSPNPFFYIQKTQNTMSYIFNMIISYHSKILKQVLIVTHIFFHPLRDNNILHCKVSHSTCSKKLHVLAGVLTKCMYVCSTLIYECSKEPTIKSE